MQSTETDESTETTVTPDPVAPSTPTGPSVPGKDEDGNTTITTPTVTPGTETTTTTGSGTASADNEQKPDVTETAPDDINVKDELDDAEIPWDVKADDEKKIGKTDYVVKDVQNNGDKQTLTLEKTETKTDKMTPEDIAKLVDADYKPGDEEGTYTLTREDNYVDEDGNEHTVITYIKVTGDGQVTTTTTTILKVIREKVGHTEAGKVESKIEYPDVTVTNENDSKDSFTIKKEELESLIEQAKKDQNTKTEGKKTTYTTTKDGKTYTITVDESAVETLSDAEIYEKANLDKEKYALGADGKIYYIGNGERVELTPEQKDAFRKTLSITVKVEENVKGTEDKVEEGKNPEEIKNDVAIGSIKDALNNAVEKLLKDGTITEEEANALKAKISAATAEDLNTAEGSVFKADNIGKDNKSFELKYSGAAVDDKGTPKADTDTKTDITDHEVNGTAYVTGGSKTWEGSGSYSKLVEGNLDDGISKDFNVPENAENISITEKDGIKTVTYTIGDKSYTLTYTTPNAEQLAKIRSDLEAKLRAEGLTDAEIHATISNENFQWVSWTVTHTKTESKTETDTTVVDLSDDSWSISDKNATSGVTIKVNGVEYKDLSTKDGKTYTGKTGDQYFTIKIGATKDLTDVKAIGDLLKDKYGDFEYKIDTKTGTATYLDKDGYEHTIEYTNATTTSIKVIVQEETSYGTISGSAPTEAEAEKELMDAIEAARKDADRAGCDLVIGDMVIKPGFTFEEIKHVLESVNYGQLTGQDLIDYLNKAKEDANKGSTEKEKNAYTGNGYYDEWGGKKGLYNKNTIGHLDLGTSSKLTTVDGEEVDCVLVKKELYWNESAEDLVGEGKNNQKVGLIDRITFDNEEGRGKGHYEYPRASWDDYTEYWNETTQTWETRHIDNYPTTSQFYKVTGTIAYGLYTEEVSNRWGTTTVNRYYDETVANQKLDELKDKYPDARVVTIYNGQDEDSDYYYQIYLYQSEMTSYGYLAKSNNNCANKTFGYNKNFDPRHQNSNAIGYVGGYDLMLSNLTQISKEQITGQQTFDYKANLFYRKRQGEEISGDNNALRITSDSYKHNVSQTVTDAEGNGYHGTYDVSFKQDFSWKDSCGKPTKVKGEAHDSYTTFRDLIHKIFNGKASGKSEGGSFQYSYKTEKDAELSPVSKTETSVKHAKVDYTYTTVDTAHVLIPGETTVIVPPTPDDPEPPAPPKEEEEVVTPDTPDLPPVQDETPDAEPIADVIVAPANPETPPVQDAAPDVLAALPKTGVNWTAALGMALSGMALMAAGAFTSLFHKEKH